MHHDWAINQIINLPLIINPVWPTIVCFGLEILPLTVHSLSRTSLISICWKLFCSSVSLVFEIWDIDGKYDTQYRLSSIWLLSKKCQGSGTSVIIELKLIEIFFIENVDKSSFTKLIFFINSSE